MTMLVDHLIREQLQASMRRTVDRLAETVTLRIWAAEASASQEFLDTLTGQRREVALALIRVNGVSGITLDELTVALDAVLS